MNQDREILERTRREWLQLALLGGAAMPLLLRNAMAASKRPSGIVDARGERIELRGFGAFSTKRRAARTGRNPRTGDRVRVTKKVVPFFKTGKEMRERLDGAEI